jgi:hypothetical protein
MYLLLYVFSAVSLPESVNPTFIFVWSTTSLYAHGKFDGIFSHTECEEAWGVQLIDPA